MHIHNVCSLSVAMATKNRGRDMFWVIRKHTMKCIVYVYYNIQYMCHSVWTCCVVDLESFLLSCPGMYVP